MNEVQWLQFQQHMLAVETYLNEIKHSLDNILIHLKQQG